VLDLGCGIGNLSNVLAQLVSPGQVVAIDPDEKRIEIAKKEKTADNMEYLVAGADNIPGENYDIIFSNYVLHWIPHNKSLFGPIARLLKEGGRFAFCTVGVITEEYFDKNYGWTDEEDKPKFMNAVHGLTESDVKRLAKENGFEVKFLESDSSRFEYENAKDFIHGHMVHGKTTPDMYDEKRISEFYGEGKIVIMLPIVSAILQKV